MIFYNQIVVQKPLAQRYLKFALENREKNICWTRHWATVQKAELQTKNLDILPACKSSPLRYEQKNSYRIKMNY